MSSLSLPPRNAEIQTQPITLKSKPTFQSSRQLTWGFRLWRQIELLLHLGEIHYRDSNPRSSVGHLNVWPILVATGVNFKFAGHRNFFSIQKRLLSRDFSAAPRIKNPQHGEKLSRENKNGHFFVGRSTFPYSNKFQLSCCSTVITSNYFCFWEKKFQEAFQFFWLKRKMEPSFGKVHDYYNLSLSLFFLYSQSWLQPRSHYRKPSYIIEAYYLLRGSSKPAAWKASSKPLTTLLANKVYHLATMFLILVYEGIQTLTPDKKVSCSFKSTTLVVKVRLH